MSEAPGALQNWDDLRFFLAVAEAGSLAKAAKRLRVKVSTVHRRIGSLEDQWSVRLFERTSKGLSLTPSGTRLLPDAQRVRAAVNDLDAGVSRVESRTVVRLTATDDLSEFLAEHVARFTRERAIQVRFLTGERVFNLAQREADVAIRFAAPEHDELVVRPLGSMAFGLYASADYVAQRGPLLSPDELGEHLFTVAEGALAESPPMRWLIERVPPSQVAALGNTVSTLAATVRGGLGIGVLPCFVADADPQLARVHGPIEGVAVHPQLMVHYRTLQTADIQAFVRYLEKVFGEHADRFLGRID